MLVFSSSGINIYFDETKECLVQTWSGFVSSEVFWMSINTAVHFVKNTKPKSILSNTLNQKVDKPDDSEYVASVMSNMFKDGVKAMAFVMPENVLTQLSLKDHIQTPSYPIMNFFSNTQDADRWLESQ